MKKQSNWEWLQFFICAIKTDIKDCDKKCKCVNCTAIYDVSKIKVAYAAGQLPSPRKVTAARAPVELPPLRGGRKQR